MRRDDRAAVSRRAFELARGRPGAWQTRCSDGAGRRLTSRGQNVHLARFRDDFFRLARSKHLWPEKLSLDPWKSRRFFKLLSRKACLRRLFASVNWQAQALRGVVEVQAHGVVGRGDVTDLDRSQNRFVFGERRFGHFVRALAAAACGQDALPRLAPKQTSEIGSCSGCPSLS